MNTWQLAEDFRKAFEDSGNFAGDAQLHGQDDGTFTAPCEVFSVTEAPFSASGKAGKITLMVAVHSMSGKLAPDDPDPEVAHAARVTAVRAMLLGDGKAALLARLNALGSWSVKGWSAMGEDPDVQGTRFYTPVRIVGTVVEL